MIVLPYLIFNRALSLILDRNIDSAGESIAGQRWMLC
jgi:hypothetical protein